MYNRIGGVTVVIECGFEPLSGQIKDYKIRAYVFIASPLSTQHEGERVKTGSESR